jgi:hypothetical protein
MINAFRRLLRYIEVLNNKRKLKFEIVVKNKIPRIQVKEKHEKKVKNITRLITAFGILISVVSFSEWYYSLGVAILIFTTGQIFEKIIFTYTIMMIQPLPEKWDGSKWTLMIVGYKEDTPILGFGFNDDQVAKDFFNTILSWNNGDCKNENNIVISLVLEDANNYSVHVYPNLERDFVIKSMKETKERFKYDKYGKDQTNLVMQIDFCKVFPNGPQSAYNLLRGYKGKVIVTVFDTRKFNEEKPKETIKYLRPFDNREILFDNIKVSKRRELNRKMDYVEFYHIPT